MKIIIILIFILTAGCATTANYEKVLDSWVGNHLDNLIGSWGIPDKSIELSNGGAMVEYIRESTTVGGGGSYTVPKTTHSTGNATFYGGLGKSATGSYSGSTTTYIEKNRPVYTVHRNCRTRFTIDISGIITKWGWEGNNCKAKDPKYIKEGWFGLPLIR